MKNHTNIVIGKGVFYIYRLFIVVHVIGDIIIIVFVDHVFQRSDFVMFKRIIIIDNCNQMYPLDGKLVITVLIISH